jgi:hypothetical protein
MACFQVLSLCLSHIRLMKRMNKGAIQSMNLNGMLDLLVIGIAKLQKKGRTEMKKIAAPTICAFLIAA